MVSYVRLKTNLQVAMQRLKLLAKKKTELAGRARKEIGTFLLEGKVERARIRVEHIIREDYLVEAMEMVEMYCDLLLARFGLLELQSSLDEGLEEAVASLIWCAPRLQTEVPELAVIVGQLTAKYGKVYAKGCSENALKSVNEKLMTKLGVVAPSRALVERYLVEISKALSIAYEPDYEVLQEDEKYCKSISNQDPLLVPPPPALPSLPPAPPIGFHFKPNESVKPNSTSSPSSTTEQYSFDFPSVPSCPDEEMDRCNTKNALNKPPPNTPNESTTPTSSNGKTGNHGDGGDGDDHPKDDPCTSQMFDDLRKRFAALKNANHDSK